MYLKNFTIPLWFRYFFRYCAIIWLKTFAVVVGVIWLAESLLLAKRALESASVLQQYWSTMALYSWPRLAFLCIPVVTFLAMLMAIYKFHRERKTLVVESFGLARFKWRAAFYITSLLVMALHMIIAFDLIPRAKRGLLRFENISSVNLLLSGIKSRGIYDKLPNMLLYVDDVHDRVLHRVFVEIASSAGKYTVLSAQSGYIQEKNNELSLQLTNGIIYNFDQRQQLIANIKFRQHDLKLSSKAKTIRAEKRDLRELLPMYRHYRSHHFLKKEHHSLIKRVANKMIWSLYSVMATYCALHFIAQNYSRRGVQWKMILLHTAVMIVWILGYFIVHNIVKNKSIDWFFAVIAQTLSLIIVALYFRIIRYRQIL